LIFQELTFRFLFSANIDYKWAFQISMTDVGSTNIGPGLVPGGISVNLSYDGTKADGSKDIPDNATVQGSSSGWGTMSSPDGAAGDIATTMKNIGMATIATNIVGGISGLGHFILPGNGTFSMSKPMFNNNGDFLCHLEYLPAQTKGPSTTTGPSGGAKPTGKGGKGGK
jgi:hypothetical protein